MFSKYFLNFTKVVFGVSVTKTITTNECICTPEIEGEITDLLVNENGDECACEEFFYRTKEGYCAFSNFNIEALKRFSQLSVAEQSTYPQLTYNMRTTGLIF